MWNKALNPQGYGVCKVRFVADARATWGYAHRLAWMVEKNLTRAQLKQQADLVEVSHLCGSPSCIRPDHLNLEDAATNNQRRQCQNRNVCMGHGQHPACKLLGEVGDENILKNELTWSRQETIWLVSCSRHPSLWHMCVLPSFGLGLLDVGWVLAPLCPSGRHQSKSSHSNESVPVIGARANVGGDFFFDCETCTDTYDQFCSIL